MCRTAEERKSRYLICAAAGVGSLLPAGEILWPRLTGRGKKSAGYTRTKDIKISLKIIEKLGAQALRSQFLWVNDSIFGVVVFVLSGIFERTRRALRTACAGVPYAVGCP